AAAALALLLAGGAWYATRPAATKPPQPDAKDETPGVVDPITLARQGTQELDEAVQAHKPAKGKELETAQKTIEAIQAIREKYKGTAVAKEAGKKLVPFQAEALFQTALAFAEANPAKRSETIQRYHDVVSRFGNTEAGWKAERELDKLEGAARKKVQQRFDAESQKAARLLEKRRFGQALALYDALLKEQGKSVEEAVLAEKLILTSKAEEAYQKIDQQAQESINRRSYTEAKALYTQVADTFGLEPYVGRAKAQIAVIEPLLAGASRRRLKAIDAAKYEFFLVRTEPSLALARKWELKAARQQAEKLRPDLVAADIEPYLDDYLGDLDLLASLKQRVVRRLNDKKRPVLAKAFSLGKVGGRFDPKWLESTVLAADDTEMVVRYGEVDVHRQWGQCPPDELYRLSKMAVDVALPQNRLALGVACLYAGLYRTAETELNGARAAGAEHVEPYLKRLQLSRPTVSATPDAVVARTQDEQASQLLMEAKRFMGERAWDRALYRLALLRARHASKDYDLSANLADIDQRIAQCRKHVDRMEMEADLALGRAVRLLRLDDLDDWQRTFGTWGLRDGVLRGDAAGQHDGGCLFTLQHAPSYELRLKARIVKGTGAIIRLAGKTRPNIGFWLHAQNPKLTGLLMAQATDDKPAERVRKALPIKLNEWIDVRAVVCPSFVEVAIGPTYRVRMPNTLPARHDAVQTYGVVVNAGSTAELRDLSVRVLQEQ
ncbi:hypothetical protein HQ576_10745, partial [bacterium]|nr:hypothetical protein [bacterium]